MNMDGSNTPERAKSNIEANLETLVVQSRGQILYNRSLSVAEAEAGHPLKLKPGKEHISDMSIPYRHGGCEFRVHLATRAGSNAAVGGIDRQIGFRFLPTDVTSGSGYTELTLYDSGAVMAGVDDNEDLIEHDLELGEELIGLFHREITRKRSDENDRRFERQQRLIDIGEWTLKGLAVAAVAGAIVGGTWKGSSLVNRGFRAIPTESDRFDNKEYTLQGGAIARAGEEAVTPEFSQELADNPLLVKDEVPRVYGDTSSAYKDDSVLSESDGLRELIIGSSKKPDACRASDVAKDVQPDSRIIAWTDFRNKDGSSRANELKIRLTTPSGEGKATVIACWSGRERDDGDDPRIIFDIIQ